MGISEFYEEAQYIILSTELNLEAIIIRTFSVLRESSKFQSLFVALMFLKRRENIFLIWGGEKYRKNYYHLWHRWWQSEIKYLIFL